MMNDNYCQHELGGECDVEECEMYMTPPTGHVRVAGVGWAASAE
jgi:hypothetical protein